MGISPDSTQDDLKRQYIKLAKEYHPDVNPTQNEKFR